jgi:hypothetical protein
MKTLIEGGVIVNLLVGSMVLWTASRWISWRRAFVMGSGLVALFLAIFWMPSWDKLVLSSGQFRNRQAAQYRNYEDYQRNRVHFDLGYTVPPRKGGHSHGEFTVH